MITILFFYKLDRLNQNQQPQCLRLRPKQYRRQRQRRRQQLPKWERGKSTVCLVRNMILLKRFWISLCLLFLEFTIHRKSNCTNTRWLLTERTPEDILWVIIKTDTNKWNGWILVSFLPIETGSFEQFLVNCAW